MIHHYGTANLDRDLLVKSVHHGNRMRAEERPDDPATPPEEVMAQLEHIPPFFHLHFWGLDQADGIAAQARLEMADLDTNRHMAQLHVSVEAPLRGQGIGARLLRLAAECTHAAGRSLLIASSSDRMPAGAAFLARYGFKPGQEAHVNQLRLEDLDRALMQTWLERSSERAAEYSLGFWDGPYPEDELPAIAALMEVMNTAPIGDLEIEDFRVTPELLRQQEAPMFAGGSRRLTAFVKHRSSGDFAGFTELIWKPQRPGIVNQGGTGVFPEHRNHGLGRWLKAANLERLLQENPEARFVRTGNADSNAPMLEINHQLGFKPYIATTVWQAQVSTVLERLGASA